ncbi:S-adenosyl-L-methionine-dependent methyltransferase [Aspergillus steynii IBT 23096]|uniref:S-adenosyl-L-methionine-dependent methyltransferase n=1 Tax=Aspergillus steynii IBT 23096 TaxID=1392250 RepID=A0A2I2G726_9EURO|nr:S-adenosyl-L-methionine-dependent methyltransferase [Aspergillus steynii IBT 23096]PLB48668.1 S-adenosyl-L-methionine-dependent methyltransferase [Aspergillus steynii IBT 23096]
MADQPRSPQSPPPRSPPRSPRSPESPESPKSPESRRSPEVARQPSQEQHGPAFIEPENSADGRSLGDASYTTSITSSAMNYQYEPNDEQEQDRLDLVCVLHDASAIHANPAQSHHIYRMLLKGELCRAPIKNPGRVLDIGTGTGIWAIDFADEHPNSEVIGNDLSPIQPSWIPPNCRFEVDDFEQDWSYSQGFDYIHGRELEGCIGDHDRLFRQAYESLRPNGYFEIASLEVNTYSDDNTHMRAPCLLEGVRNMHAASKMYGKDMTTVVHWKEMMENAGFVNVHEDVYKVPQSPWPKDPKLKEIGRYHQVNMFEALGPYCYALFTRVLGWQRPEIEALVAGMRNELRDLSNHLYSKVHIVYGQRPATQ